MILTPAQFKERLYQCEAAVYDLDGTLVSGRIAEGMGRRFLRREFRNIFMDPAKFYRHAYNVALGASNYRKVQRTANKIGEAEGLELFLNVLARAKCADWESAYAFVREYVESHEIPGARDFVRYLKALRGSGFLSLVTTIGTNIGANVAREYFGFDDAARSNEVLCRGGVISGVRTNVRNSAQKRDAVKERLRKHGLSIGGCLAIGNDRYDRETMEAAQLSAASPIATEETRQIADIWIRDYGEFLEELKAA